MFGNENLTCEKIKSQCLFYRCKICSIFFLREGKILAHFFDKHATGLDSFEEVIFPSATICLDRTAAEINGGELQHTIVATSGQDFDGISILNLVQIKEEDLEVDEINGDEVNPNPNSWPDFDKNLSAQKRKAKISRKYDSPNVSDSEEFCVGNESCSSDDDDQDDEFFEEDGIRPKKRKRSDPTADNNSSPAIAWIRCEHCPVKFRTNFRHQIHIARVHQGKDKPFQCDLCPRSFKGWSAVLLHIDLHHQPNVSSSLDPPPPKNPLDDENHEHKTEVSEVVFDTIFKSDLVPELPLPNEINDSNPAPAPPKRIYPRVPNPSKSFECDQCAHRFAEEWILNGHILRFHHGDKSPYQCDLCPARFHAKSLILSHRSLTHTSISIPYTGSNQSLSSRIAQLALKKPPKSNKPPPTAPLPTPVIFTCKKCPSSPQLSSRIACHIHLARCHANASTKFPCPQCDLVFLTDRGRAIHAEHFHVKKISSQKNPLHCATCDKKCATLLAFKNHVAFHSKQQPSDRIHPPPPKETHLCELCPQTFTQLRFLQDHRVRVHYETLGLNPFKCDTCGKTLTTLTKLKSHIVVKHTKQYTFPCPHDGCRIGFEDEAQLKLHVRVVHLKEKTFQCDQCPKAFGVKYNLMNHMRTHTGEKPYVCGTCGKAYADQPTYRRHLETHGDKVHKCGECGKEFKVRHAYRVHCKLHKKKKGEIV